MTKAPNDTATDPQQTITDLRRQLDEALARETATAELMRLINASPGDLAPVFDAILEKAHSLCGVTSGSLELFEGDVVRTMAARGFNERWKAWLRAGYKLTDLARPIFHAAHHQHIPDLGNLVARFPDEPNLRALYEIGGFRTFLALPLVKNGLAFGRIVAARSTILPFTDRQIALLRSFADQAVIAIENARLFEEVQEALKQQTATADVLKTISRSAFDLPIVLDTLMRTAAELCGVESGGLTVRDGNVFRYTALYGLSEEYMAVLRARPILPGRDTLAGRVILEKQVVQVADLAADSDYAVPESVKVAGIRTCLVVPLLRDGEVVGTLGVNRHRVAPFTEGQIEILRTFADQAVIAIENARLFDEVQAKTRDLTESLQQQTATADVLKTISRSAFDLQAVFDTLTTSAVDLLGMQSGTICVRDGEVFRFRSAAGAFWTEELWRYLQEHPVTPGRNTAAGRVILSGRIEQIPDILDDPEYAIPMQALTPGNTPRAMLGVPLLGKDRVEGAMVLSRQEPGPFTQREVDILQTFADQASIAIENTRLFNETQEALERQTASADILKVIASSPSDAQPVFNALVLTARRLLGREMSAILLCGEDATFRAVAGAGPDGLIPIDPLIATPTKIDPVANFPSRAIVSRKNQHLPDWSAIDLPEEERKVQEMYGWNSTLYLPMLRGEECIGVLLLGGTQPGIFSESDIALAESFRDQAVIAIENARLFNETKEALERQTATADILKVIASSPSDVQPVFASVVQTARRLLSREIAAILLCDESATTFTAVAITGRDGLVPILNPDPIKIDPNANFPSRAIVSKKIQHLPDWSTIDLPDDERKIQELYGLNSALYLPMLRGRECIGVLLLGGKQPGAFSETDIDLAESFRDQAVIAIENARLFNETREALERQTATAEVLQVISNSISNATPVFERILESTERLITCDNANIFLAMPDGQLHLAAFRGPDADSVRGMYPRPLGQTVAPVVIAARRQIVYEDVANHPDVSEGLREAARAIARGTFSAAMTPLMWKGNGIGMLNVSRDPAIKFNEKELSLLRTFADQAVIAIQNARLFEEVQARTNDLQESLEYQTATSDVLKVISRSSFDLQPVLDTLVDTAVKLCSALNGTICLREGDGYRYRASSGIHGDWAKFLDEHPPTPGRGSMTGRVLLSGRPESVPDVLEDPDYVVPLAAMNKTRSVFGVPLLRHDRVEGVLLLARAEPGLFTQRQMELVQTFADQAVIAIENARLLTELRQRTDDLTESLEHLRTAQDRLVQTEKLASLGQLTAGIAHEIKNPLNFVNNFSALSAELIDELGETLAPAPLDRKMRGDVDELTQMLKSNLEKVVQHGKRADSIVKNMLLHSREGAGEQRPADINALLDESLNLAYHGARAEKPGFNITLQRDFDASAGEIELFPQEITRAFLNLISNGFYAASKRKAENSETDFEPVLVAATRTLGSQVEIRIRDNGTGIPAEVKEKIFNPFFTTKPAGEGTGLGLSMCHDIVVKQHGGRIEVDTQPGQFTEFTIILPRTSNLANNRKN